MGGVRPWGPWKGPKKFLKKLFFENFEKDNVLKILTW